MRSGFPISARMAARRNDEHVPQHREKTLYETSVINEFCKSMRRRYGASFLAERPDSSDQLLPAVEGAAFDGLVRVNSKSPWLAAVELVSYSPDDGTTTCIDRDQDFRIRLISALLPSLDRARCNLHYVYRRSAAMDKLGRTVQRALVPSGFDQKPLIDELRSIIDIVISFPRYTFRYVKFVETETKAKHLNTISSVPAWWYTSPEAFPLAAKHFESIRFHSIPDSLDPDVDSPFSAGGVGVDQAFIEHEIRVKASKSLSPTFEQRANGKPVWLIMHADCGHICNTVLSFQRPTAVAAARRALANQVHRFSRIYWADGTGGLDCTNVSRVC